MRFLSFLMIILIFFSSTIFAKTQEPQELKNEDIVSIQKEGNVFINNIQKYSGFNRLVDFLAELIMKTLIKLKTRAEYIRIELKIYNGWGLFRKKAESLSVKIENLFVGGVPVESFELLTTTPIHFKRLLGRNREVKIPLRFNLNINMNLEKISEVLNNLPKWENALEEIELPIPPFGTTKVSVSDLKIQHHQKGLITVHSSVRSLATDNAEPIKITFLGNLTLIEKRIVISDLQSQVEDIFTSDSDLGKSFSKFLEELINPIFDFNKYEKRGLTIEDIDLSFFENSLTLRINAALMPKENE